MIDGFIDLISIRVLPFMGIGIGLAAVPTFTLKPCKKVYGPSNPSSDMLGNNTFLKARNVVLGVEAFQSPR